MPSFATYKVTRELDQRSGLQRVELHDGSRAYALTDLIGPVAVGDEVVANTTAVDLGLGTGGWHVIHWNLARREWSRAGRGEVMKLRYTSLQVDTGAAGERSAVDRSAPAGVPVVAITLHSQLAGVAAGVAARDPALRVVFVMSGGGALPLVLSDLVAGLRDRGLLSATVTAGHCFGGDLEAVGIADGLCLAAARLDAHVIITGPGPGLVGTGSDLGTTALDAAGALDVAAALRAEPVLAVRASATDERLRHRGISHHTDTVAALVRSRVDIAVPPSLAGDAAVLAAPREAGVPAHRLVLVEDPGAIALLRALQLDVATMGRDALTDELFLPAAAAAGAHAASLAAAQDHR